MIGFPVPSSQNNSRIVLTCRSSEVCGEMEANRWIQVEPLSKSQAWELFRMKVGPYVFNGHPGIEDIAREVCEVCEGLPIMLDVLGHAMSSSTTETEWKIALKKLTTQGLGDEKVLSRLALSYHNLKSEKTKACFTYLCFYVPFNYIKFENKVDLLLQWFSSGLIGEDGDYYKALDEGYLVLRELQCAGLCQIVHHFRVGYYVFYKIHDLIKEMGRWVANQGHARNFRNLHLDANIMHNDEIYREAEGLFLCESNVEELVKIPDSPNLSVLILFHNHRLKTISEDFFAAMPNLKVLLMVGCTNMKTLPEGIGALKLLRYLNIQDTNLERFPGSIKELTNMQMLLLNIFVEVPSGVISCFKGLLYFSSPACLTPLIINVFRELDSLEHLKSVAPPHLPYLSTTFDFFITSRKIRKCTSCLRLSGVESMREDLDISILCGMECLETFQFDTFPTLVRIVNQNNQIASNNLAFPRYLVSLTLDECPKLEDISELVISLTSLEDLTLSDCGRMKYILKNELSDRWDQMKQKPFGKLKILTIMFMTSLEFLCPDTLCWPYLSSFKALECPMLCKLPFSSENAKSLTSITGMQDWFDDLRFVNKDNRDFATKIFKPLEPY